MQFVDLDLFGLEMIILKGDLSNKSNTLSGGQWTIE